VAPRDTHPDLLREAAAAKGSTRESGGTATAGAAGDKSPGSEAAPLPPPVPAPPLLPSGVRAGPRRAASAAEDAQTFVQDASRPTSPALPAHGHETTSPGVIPGSTGPARPPASSRDSSPRESRPRGDKPGSDPQIVAGRYQIIRPIGEGSMGRIFLAEQVSVGRRVALKIINREFSAKYDTIARFQQEARLLASVRDEHIVDIYDIGETESGDPFIAMEFVDGPSLAQLLREGPMEPARAIRLLLQVASALATVHAAGAVHRDLKPANIVVVRLSGGREMVKILDFGLAKVLSDREHSERLTRTGSIVGTPEYMSPEQVTGGQVDHRADMYGFGCTAYEMLCGKPPFLGAEVSTLYKHMHEAVPPLDKQRAGLPGPLVAVIHRCLEKRPADRFPDMQALHAALLDAADRAGIARESLIASRSGIDSAIGRAGHTGSVVAPGPRRRDVVLGVVTALVVGLVGGVLLDRLGTGGGAGSAGGEGAARATVGAVAPAPGKGVLLVSTVPPGIDVRVDEREPGPSPLVVRDLPGGQHQVMVSGRGWMPKHAAVEVVPGQLTELVVTLERPRYTMKIISEPPGATVTVDGKELGITPIDASLTELEFHELNFRRDGYRDRDVYIAPDSKEESLRVVLQPVLLNAGSIIVNSEYPGKVFIDGQDTSEWTPTGEIQLAPGKHVVELVDNMNVRRKVTVTITRNQLLTLDVPAPKAAP
jgi:predicted Ser/Thr protein kinase